MITVILMMIVAFLILVFGVMILFGASQDNRHHAIAGFVAGVGGSVWSIASSLRFLSGGTSSVDSFIAYFMCLGALVAELGMAYFLSDSKKSINNALLLILSTVGFLVMLIPFFDINMLNDTKHWFYIVYSTVVAFSSVAICISIALNNKINSTNKVLLFVWWFVNMGLSAIFTMLLPLQYGNNNFLWAGPVSELLLILAIYVSLFNSYWINVSSEWVKRMSYVVVIFTSIMLYIVAVYLIAKFIFGWGEPDYMGVIFVAIISVVLALILLAIRKATSSMRSLLSSADKIDFSYVMSQLGKINPRSDKTRLAVFLSHHLHLSYIGFLIDGKLYGSRPMNFSEQELNDIRASMDNSELHGIWQDIDLPIRYIIAEFGCSDIACLRDDGGNILGQVIVGKPNSNNRLSYKQLNVLEMVLNETANMLSSKHYERQHSN
mgnify:CR=1 FL=1